MNKKNAALIFQVLKEYIFSNELKIQGRMKAKDFIRERIFIFPYNCLIFSKKDVAS